jgi:cell division protein FtsW (lipid II flippase)
LKKIISGLFSILLYAAPVALVLFFLANAILRWPLQVMATVVLAVGFLVLARMLEARGRSWVDEAFPTLTTGCRVRFQEGDKAPQNMRVSDVLGPVSCPPDPTGRVYVVLEPAE